MKLVVLVPTFRRPELLVKTLASLASQEGFADVEILVSDNDAEKQEGLTAAQAHAAANGYEDRLTTRTVAEKGFAQNRNAGLGYAFETLQADAVAMIDDDATADEGWIEEIQSALETEPAAIYGGPSHYVAGPGAVPWITELDLFKPPFSHSGAVPRLRSSNNCIITRDLWERFGRQLFDIRFSASGGEDTKLFIRVAEEGLRSYWIETASVTEPIPEARAKLSWVLDRHYTSAVNSARIDFQNNGAKAFLRQGILAVKEVLTGLVRLLSPDAKTRFVGRMRFKGAFGRIAGLSGVRVLHDTHSSSQSVS